jgi:gluconokinase
MPASLLASQLATLEPLQPDEPGVVVHVPDPPGDVAGDVIAALALPAAAPGDDRSAQDSGSVVTSTPRAEPAT